MTASTRGPLPAGVYWRRRLFVLGLLAAIVFALVSAVRGGGHADADAAATMSATTDTSTLPESGSANRSGKAPSSEPRTTSTAAPEPDPAPAAPEGTCEDRDVSVAPVVEDSVAGQPVTITLKLRTLKTPACYWRVSSKHLAVKITDGSTLIWTSQQCRFGIPQSDVVVRRDLVSTVTMKWRARESKPGCPRATDWVLPGDFTATAAALGGEPATDTFNLTRPAAGSAALPPRTTPDLTENGKSKNSKSKNGQTKNG